MSFENSPWKQEIENNSNIHELFDSFYKNSDEKYITYESIFPENEKNNKILSYVDESILLGFKKKDMSVVSFSDIICSIVYYLNDEDFIITEDSYSIICRLYIMSDELFKGNDSFNDMGFENLRKNISFISKGEIIKKAHETKLMNFCLEKIRGYGKLYLSCYLYTENHVYTEQEMSYINQFVKKDYIRTIEPEKDINEFPEITKINLSPPDIVLSSYIKNSTSKKLYSLYCEVQDDLSIYNKEGITLFDCIDKIIYFGRVF